MGAQKLTTTRRRLLKGSAATTVLGAAGIFAPAIVGRAKKFDGVVLNGVSTSSIYLRRVKELLPEFEEMTGMTVNYETLSFPIHNQRVDLELSTQGSAYDFVNLTFIYTGRWISAGWLTQLDHFVNDPNLTDPDWNPGDFVAGAQKALQDGDGNTFGFAHFAGAMLTAAGRYDLIENAGMGLPKDFDELIAVCEAVHGQEGVAAWISDRNHHWNSIPYLMGFGGEIFVDPPHNLTPLLDSPQNIEGAAFYGRLLRDYAPSGVLTFDNDVALRTLVAGQANMRTGELAWELPMATAEESAVKDTVRFGLTPSGPAGWYPGNNSHGYAIPAGSNNKEAAWAFIQWALSKDVMERIAKEQGFAALCRRSIITSDWFRESLQINGDDVASLYLEVLERGGEEPYMRYRTVPIFPQIGDKLNKAIEKIATNQQNAEEAMQQAQAEAVQQLKLMGVEIDL
jgi:multiple sugar transport system substrate-binding protein